MQDTQEIARSALDAALRPEPLPACSEPLPAGSHHLPAGPEALRLLIHASRDAGMIASFG